MRLTGRDIELLGFVSEQGVVTSTQLRSVFFPTLGSCQQRISALLRSGFLESKKAQDVKTVSKRALDGMAVLLQTRRGEVARFRLYVLGPVFKKTASRDNQLCDVNH